MLMNSDFAKAVIGKGVSVNNLVCEDFMGKYYIIVFRVNTLI